MGKMRAEAFSCSRSGISHLEVGSLWNMESKFVLLVGLFVVLPVVDCSRADLKVVNASAHTGLDPKIALLWNETDASNENTGRSSLVLNSTKFGKVKIVETKWMDQRRVLLLRRGRVGGIQAGNHRRPKLMMCKRARAGRVRNQKGRRVMMKKTLNPRMWLGRWATKGMWSLPRQGGMRVLGVKNVIYRIGARTRITSWLHV
ncbi:uncharacterized protein LOC121237794 [Juglans microcarpa x Juglans regia]|uniref:uncharacterized protein LOC121237794 n=1 Tax=Juglans microcarpa x Juglans regia TaxID=2249226 RepID=UPI001B7F6783|nr:uncharacterized protein LOC121237794 [Juglans microcarpa x Juglans regia]